MSIGWGDAHSGTMSLISLILALAVIGVVLWLVNAYLPIDGKIKQLINIVAIICIVWFVLTAFGVVGSLHDIKVPQVK